MFLALLPWTLGANSDIRKHRPRFPITRVQGGHQPVRPKMAGPSRRGRLQTLFLVGAVLLTVGCGGSATNAPTTADFVLNGWPAPSWLKIPTVTDLANYPGNLNGYYSP